MIRFTPEQKQFARSFLVYQAEQPQGLPKTKEELQKCYGYFAAIQPPNTLIPSFREIITILVKIRLIKIRAGEVIYTRNVIVDQRMAARKAEAAARSPFYCALCRCSCYDHINFISHLSGIKHRANVQVTNLNKSLTENEADKNGISISSLDFVTFELGSRSTKLITITNNSNHEQVLLACELMNKSKSLTLSDPAKLSENKAKQVIRIGSNQNYSVSLECNAFNLGWIRDILVFRFAPGFTVSFICRYIKIQVDSEGSRDLAPTSPYQFPPRIADEIPSSIVPGEPIQRATLSDLKPLPRFNISPKVHAALNKGLAPNIGNLVPFNYKNYFSHLLWFEEAQMNVDIRRYDMLSAMSSHRSYIFLKVPGLAENRPSLLVGDSVYVSHGTKEYEGVVHRVEMETVSLKFARYFHQVIFQPAAQYKIRFSFNRTPLRRMHQAIDLSLSLNPQTLFPEGKPEDFQETSKILQIERELKPINRRINGQQARAVAAILSNSAFPCPYVIFGPPGTGKTMTLVEAIGQVYSIYPNARILACAPSNTAADLLTERLDVVQRRHIYRFNAFNRRHDIIPKKVFEVSSFEEETGTFKMPRVEYFYEKKVVVSTCVNAGVLTGLGISPFTHVFIDEAGQAMETEALVSISGLINAYSTLVLAGDPEQLGPVIRSTFAKKEGKGLERSLLERIIQFSPYHWDPRSFSGYGNYDVRFLTKLVNNYRSHPDILSLPNELFYHNELLPMADAILRTSMCDWDELPRKGFPIIFHGIEGVDQREGNSPSWFNVPEVLQIGKYIDKLLSYRSVKISMPDIGVITPYRKQAEKIRTHLRGKGKEGVKVGSVEEFQGQERLVIIISCVRSNIDYIGFDNEHNLGFLKNPKRFNVAITRAQALLIVIGNPHVLVHDPNWKRLLDYCSSHNAYTGCNLPSSSVDVAVDDLLQLVSRLGLEDNNDKNNNNNNNNNNVGQVSQVEAHEGPEWKTY